MSDVFVIEIPRALIQEAAAAEVREFFASPSYQRQAGGSGRQQISRTVETEGAALLASDDVREMVKQQIRLQLPGVVREAVGEELSKVIRAEVARQRKEGGFKAAAGEQLQIGGDRG